MKPGNYKAEEREKVFKNRLIEFSTMSGTKKFKQSEKVRFSDGALAAIWFNTNMDIISKMDNEYARLIMSQYVEKKKIETEEKLKRFNEKKLEFEQEKDMRKFSNSHRTVKFIDGTTMSTWFGSAKNMLLNGNDEISKSIKSQYEEYKILFGRTRHSFEKRLIEFEAIDDINKFSKYCNITFKDGAFVGTWFSTVGKRALELTDDVSVSIQKQHAMYLEEKVESREKRYQRRVVEFYNESSNKKFKPLESEYKFTDGCVMGSWFARYKNRIMSSDDEMCKIIKKQYLIFKRNRGYNRDEFENRLLEFEQEQNLDKFKQTDCQVLFKDGANKGAWFLRNKKIINSLDDNELCISILKQYDEYLSLPENWKAKLVKEIHEKKKEGEQNGKNI